MQTARISLLPPIEDPTRRDLADLDVADELDEGWDAVPQQNESSYVGTLPREESGLELARRRHSALTAAVAVVEDECASFESYDVSAQAAELSLRKRVGLLALVRNSLEAVVDISAQEDRLEGPLAPYFAGAYLWLDGVTEALGRLAIQLNAMQPEWASFRSSLAEVQWLYEMTLVEQARVEASEAFGGTALGEALEDLTAAIVNFKAALEEPFG
jgi:hypothetical protein